MSYSADPKGYYALLGLSPSATADEIKAAYRRRAKEVHPDHNPSPSADVEFQQLSEAYHTLYDGRKRARYDAGASHARKTATNAAHSEASASGTQDHADRSSSTSRSSAREDTSSHRQSRADGGSQRKTTGYAAYSAASAASAQASARGSGQARTASRPHRHGTSAYNQAAGTARRGQPVAPPCSCHRCGKLAAQPRYVVFPLVRGRLFRLLRSQVEGVFCRRCADILALQTALKTWLLGWWAIPLGPVFALLTLVTLARGGIFPREKNFNVLLKQSRAFQARHDRALAYGLALQAKSYAENDTERALADGILRSTAESNGSRVLKNRWHGLSRWRLAQAIPPLVVITSLWMLFTAPGGLPKVIWPWQRALPPLEAAYPPLLRPPPAVEGVQVDGLERPTLLRTGRLYEVTAQLVMYTGPAVTFKDIRELDVGAMVLVMENAPEGGWVRVLAGDGTMGYVQGRYLTPGLPNRTLEEGTTTPKSAAPPPAAPAVGAPAALRPAEGG